MANSSTSLFLFVFMITIFCLLFTISSSSSLSFSKYERPGTIVLPLTRTPASKQHRKPFANFERLAATVGAIPRPKTSLFPHSYGGHTVTLSFGTPPQKLAFLVDTGSQVVWAPCTTHYTCTNCSFSPDQIKTFNPQLSSSSRTLGCKSYRCVNTDFPEIHLGCPNCSRNSLKCSQDCPPYTLQYAAGASSGYFLTETLHFPQKTVEKFLLGCTTSGSHETITDALAGFGRTLFSFPVQMGVNKFAYCLNSHIYDDTHNSGKLVLDYNEAPTKGLSNAALLQNPPTAPVYYYLGVKDIMIGNKFLRIPSNLLVPTANGNGGVVIDSGFAYGFMTTSIYKMVTHELKWQMSKYDRSREAEAELGFKPCYNFTGHKSVEIPSLVYQFTSGASMVIPGKNYFLFIREINLGCFPVTTEGSSSLDVTLLGPAVILGNYQQVDHYIEFDLKNQLLGFRPETC